jgi:hypothetical protein
MPTDEWWVCVYRIVWRRVNTLSTQPCHLIGCLYLYSKYSPKYHKYIMRKNLQLSVFALFTFLSSTIGQEYRNALKLESGDFINPEVYNPKLNLTSRLVRQDGLSFEHKLTHRVSLSFGLSIWNTNLFIGQPNYDINKTEVRTVKHNAHDDLMLSRSNYKMLDVSVGYSFIATKRHELRACLGASIAKGKDYYTDITIPPPLPPGWFWYDGMSNGYEKSDAHLGLISSLSYDYHISKGHWSVGADFKCRKYFAFQSVELDYGLHLGYRFGKM